MPKFIQNWCQKIWRENTKFAKLNININLRKQRMLKVNWIIWAIKLN